MSVIFPYNPQHEPPAPFVLVSVYDASLSGVVRDVPTQVDTGAYRTVLPLQVVEALGLQPGGTAPVGGLDGSVANLPVFEVILVMKGFPTGHRVEVLASPNEVSVLLGRDILNHYRILLDGPNLRLEIL
jgi:predicted aspartyl protease